MNTQTVDRVFAALQEQAQQTAGLISALAAKLSDAAAAGDPNAREWGLDLKEIALAVRDEQSGTTELLTAIHALVDNHVQATRYALAGGYQSPPPQYSQGGTLQRFLGGRFGQAIVAGAGIGIGDDLVNGIFDRL